VIRPPETLAEAWMEARATVLQIRAARTVAFHALSQADTPLEELSHADDVYDLDCRERIVLDALRAADVHTDL